MYLFDYHICTDEKLGCLKLLKWYKWYRWMQFWSNLAIPCYGNLINLNNQKFGFCRYPSAHLTIINKILRQIGIHVKLSYFCPYIHSNAHFNIRIVFKDKIIKVLHTFKFLWLWVSSAYEQLLLSSHIYITAQLLLVRRRTGLFLALL